MGLLFKKQGQRAVSSVNRGKWRYLLLWEDSECMVPVPVWCRVWAVTHTLPLDPMQRCLFFPFHSFIQPARGLALLGERRKSQLELDS